MDLSLDVPSSVLPTLQTLYYNGDSAISLAMNSNDITIVNNPGLLCPQFVYSITTVPASPAASQIWLPSTFYADISIHTGTQAVYNLVLSAKLDGSSSYTDSPTFTSAIVIVENLAHPGSIPTQFYTIGDPALVFEIDAFTVDPNSATIVSALTW